MAAPAVLRSVVGVFPVDQALDIAQMTMGAQVQQPLPSTNDTQHRTNVVYQRRIVRRWLTALRLHLPQCFRDTTREFRYICNQHGCSITKTNKEDVGRHFEHSHLGVPYQAGLIFRIHTLFWMTDPDLAATRSCTDLASFIRGLDPAVPQYMIDQINQMWACYTATGREGRRR